MADRIRAIRIVTNYKLHLSHTAPDLICPVQLLFQFLRRFAIGSCTARQASESSRLCYSATRSLIFKKSFCSNILSKIGPHASRSHYTRGMHSFLSISCESYPSIDTVSNGGV